MIALSLDCLESRSLPSTGLLPPLNEFAGAASAQFTPPIGSNKGSFAADGAGADHFSKNQQASKANTDVALSLYQSPTPSRQGIIAILIGL
jgi:hypothetical protein